MLYLSYPKYTRCVLYLISCLSFFFETSLYTLFYNINYGIYVSSVKSWVAACCAFKTFVFATSLQYYLRQSPIDFRNILNYDRYSSKLHTILLLAQVTISQMPSTVFPLSLYSPWFSISFLSQALILHQFHLWISILIKFLGSFIFSIEICSYPTTY